MLTQPHVVSRLVVLFSLVAALGACGDNATLAPPDAPPEAPPRPGVSYYAVHSQLDLADNLPGEVGHAVDELIEATDDPDDPTRYLVDRMIARMDDGTWKQLALAAEPFVTAYVNDRLLARSPQLLARLIAVGRGLGDAAREFGTLDTLAIAPDGSAVHAIVGVRVTLDGATIDLPFDEHGLELVSADVAVQASHDRLDLQPHTLRLSLGKVLRLVLDGAIVPHVDPGAVDLVGVLQGGVDCGEVGQAMHDALGFGSPSGFAAACRDALTSVAVTVYDELDAIDADELRLHLTGHAHAVDADGDGRVDALTGGTWTGSIDYAGTPAPLAGGSFTGARVQ